MSRQFISDYLSIVASIANSLKGGDSIQRMIDQLRVIRLSGGRLYIAGLGGSAANASHATNDFRKLCNINTICLTENVSELTARINDDGFETCLVRSLEVSQFDYNDGLLILSVGGGDFYHNVSVPLIRAIDYASEKKAFTGCIVGDPTGYAARMCDVAINIPRFDYQHITPHAEEFQSVILHLMVSHPDLKRNSTKW